MTRVQFALFGRPIGGAASRVALLPSLFSVAALVACGGSDSGPTADAGSITELGEMAEPVHLPDIHTWIVVTDGGAFVALSDVDPHPDFRAEHCTITWRADIVFEEQAGVFRGKCSGTVWNRLGERQYGPSPRDMDRYSTSIQDGRLLVNVVKPVCSDAVGEEC